MTSLGLVQSPDTLLKSQQTLVDLGSILFRLLASVYYVSTSLRAGQVDERHLTEQLASMLDGVS